MAKICIYYKSKEVVEIAKELGVSPQVAAAMIQTVINRKFKEAHNISQEEDVSEDLEAEDIEKYFPSIDEIKQHLLEISSEENKIKETFEETRKEIIELEDKDFTMEMDQLRKDFDTQTRMDRATTIANLFSTHIDDLEEQYPGKSRKEIIDMETPAKIFNKVKQDFQDELDFNGYFVSNDVGGFDWITLSDSQRDKLQKVINNFNELAIISTREITKLESIKFKISDNITEELTIDYNEVENIQDDEDENTDSLSEPTSKEEYIKEGWQSKYFHVNPHSTLSKNVRKVLSRIEKMDANMMTEVDDLGYKRYLDAELVHSILLNHLKYMEKASDLIPMLEKLSVNKPWVNGIIIKLEEDPSLMSAFYSDMRKDSVQFFSQTETRYNGRFYFKTRILNKQGSENSIIDDVKSNIESSIVLSDNSVYDEDGNLNKENIKNNITLLRKLSVEYPQKVKATINTPEKGNKYIEDWINDNLNELTSLFRSIGIDIDNEITYAALTQTLYKNNKEVPSSIIVNDVFFSFQSIFNELNKSNYGKGAITYLYNLVQSKYNTLISYIAPVMDIRVEDVIHHNGKSYYTYVTPSYLRKTINKLKNVIDDKERFNKYIEDEYKKSFLIYKDGKFRPGWLAELTDDSQKGAEARRILDFKTFISFNKKEYGKLLPFEYTLSLWTEFFSDPTKKTAWFAVPTLGDAPVAEFIKFRRYTDDTVKRLTGTNIGYKEFLLDKLVDLALQELDRMWLVDEMNKNDDIEKISNFSTRGLQFQFIPELNKYLPEIRKMIDEDVTGVKLENYLKTKINLIMEETFKKDLNKWEKEGLLDTVSDKNKSLKYFTFEGTNTKEQAIKLLENYFWNSYYATSQIIQIANGDLAFYKGSDDFQKRNKQHHSPAIRGNTNATIKTIKKINGKEVEVEEKVGRETELSMYIKDNFVKSAYLSSIEEGLSAKVERGDITEYDKEEILSHYRDGQINETDSASFRSLLSYRRLLGMFGRWDEKTMEPAYQRIQDGTWSMEDFNIVWQAIKPFTYSIRMVDTGIKDEDGNPIYIRKPIQHKTAEYLLLPTKNIIKDSPKLQAIAEFMEEDSEDGRDIDVIHFESAVKEAVQGVVDINNIDDVEEIKRVLREAKKNPQMVHEVSYEDYGIQQEVPEKFLDTLSIFGTQLRKLVFEDMPDDLEIEVEVAPNKKITKTKKEWLQLYNELITASVIDSFREVDMIFSSPKELEKVLKDEIRSSSIYGYDMEVAVTLDKDGNFNIPLFDPAIGQKVQELVLSIIRNRVTKQKIKGGSLVQIPAYGLPDLHIEFKEEYDKKLKKKVKSIQYLECYMPWYTQKYFEPLLDPATGELDINKKDSNGNYIVPQELRRLVAYRIPTEYGYSILPLYIKGFLPKNAGGAIMLPSEITKIMVIDFDIDKLYFMIFLIIPEFEVSNDNINKTRSNLIRLFRKQNPHKSIRKFKEEINTILDEISFMGYNKDYRVIDDLKSIEDEDLKEFIIENWDQFKIEPSIKKVQYDFSKSPLKNSKAQRNNMILDIIYGILTNHNNIDRFFNPGGFDKLKKIAKIITALQSIEYDKLKELAKNKNGDIYKYLKGLSLDELNNLIALNTEGLNILDPTTQVWFYEQNTIASQLISIFASHNVNHALLQNTRVSLKDAYSYDFLIPRGFKDLYKIKARDGSYIGKNIAEFLSAAVDALKDPVLRFLNIDTFTADIAMLLIRTSYTAEDVALLFSQPIIVEMLEAFKTQSKNGYSKAEIINMVLNKYTEETEGNYVSRDNEVIDTDMLIKNIINSKRLINGKKITDLTFDERMHSSDYAVRSYFKSQAQIGRMFKTMSIAAQGLSNLVAATRADTSNGGPGPTIAATELKIAKTQNFIYNEQSQNAFFNNAENLIKIGIDLNSFHTDENGTADEKLLRELVDSPLPLIQSFYTLGLEGTQYLLSRYFPQYKDSFRYVANQLIQLAYPNKIDAKLLNTAYNHLFTYILSGNKNFGGGDVETIEKELDYYLNKFPQEFQETVQNNPNLKNNEFISQLKVVKKIKYKNPIIILRNGNHLSQIRREDLSSYWADLLYMGDEKKDIAIKLLKYSIYRSGFSFIPDSFVQLAPVHVKRATPGYMATLLRLLKEPDSYDKYQPFIMQFLLHNINDRRLVPVLDVNKTSFKDRVFNEKKEPVDTIIIDLRHEATLEDKKATVYTKYDKDNKTITEVVWKPVIAIEHNGKLIPYVAYNIRLETSDPVMIYTKTNILGNKGI